MSIASRKFDSIAQGNRDRDNRRALSGSGNNLGRQTDATRRRTREVRNEVLGNPPSPISSRNADANRRKNNEMAASISRLFSAEDLSTVRQANAQAIAGQGRVRDSRVQLGGGRRGTTRSASGQQAANAELTEASNRLSDLIDRGGPLSGFARGERDRIQGLIETNEQSRIHALSFIGPNRAGQRRAIRLSQEVQTGRRRARSSSNALPLAAGLFASSRTNRF
jgi:hypothetical protein